jgi:hypothetical protein
MRNIWDNEIPPPENPQLPQPRGSRLAVVSLALALSPVLSIPLLCICHHIGSNESCLRVLEIIALVTFLASPLCAITSVVVIFRSHGRLTGYNWAVCGMLIVGISTAIVSLSGSRVPKGAMLYERICNADVLCDALRRYEHDHKQLPPHLSSLVPEYLSLSNAGALFGPTNYPQFVQSEFRRTVKSAEDAKAADEHGPYVYLGYTNRSSGIILFEKPTAWQPYPASSSNYGNVWAVRRDNGGTMVSEELLRAWGIWPTVVSETPELKINQLAVQCLTDIMRELAALGKMYPAFKEIKDWRVYLAPNPSEDVYCSVDFQYRVKRMDNKLGQYVYIYAPEDSGILLDIAFSEHLGKHITTRLYRATFGAKEIYAYCRLKTGKDAKQVETPVWAIIEKKLKVFSDAWHRVDLDSDR